MMSNISPREEQPSSKAKKSFKTLYDERKKSLRTEGLSSSYDHPGLVHSDVDFTPSPRHDKNKKALSNSAFLQTKQRLEVKLVFQSILLDADI